MRLVWQHLLQCQEKQCCKHTVILVLNACDCQNGWGDTVNALFMWIMQNRLSSYVSLIELTFWKRLKVEALIMHLGCTSSMKLVCMSLKGHRL